MWLIKYCNNMNKIINFFFSDKLSLSKKILFLIIATVISYTSLSDLATGRGYFDTWSDAQITSSIYAHANELNIDYEPFKRPVVLFWENGASKPFIFSGSELNLDELPDENSEYSYYKSQYVLLAHVGAVVMEKIGVQDIKTINSIMYISGTLISLGVFLFLLLYLFNISGSVIPLLLALSVWSYITIDSSLWLNYGLFLAPVALMPIILAKLDSIDNYWRRAIVLFTTIFLLFFISSLINYDYISTIATTVLAFHFYIINREKMNYRLWIPDAGIISFAIVTGLLTAIIFHLQIISLEEFLHDATKRSQLSDVYKEGYCKHNRCPTYSDLMHYLSKTIIILFIVPSIWMAFTMKNKQYIVPILSLCLSLFGIILWCAVFPYTLFHASQIEQSFAYSIFPMLLLISSYYSITSFPIKIKKFLRDISV